MTEENQLKSNLLEEIQASDEVAVAEKNPKLEDPVYKEIEKEFRTLELQTGSLHYQKNFVLEQIQLIKKALEDQKAPYLDRLAVLESDLVKAHDRMRELDKQATEFLAAK